MANKETMTPKSRVLSSIFGGRVDRAAVGNSTAVVTHQIMDEVGVSFPDAHTDPEKMAKLAAASYEILGWDTIKVPFCVWNLTAALNMPMDWGSRDKWPDGKHVLYSDPSEIKIPDDFLERESTSALLEAVKILRRKYPHVCIVGTVMGTFTQSFNIFGTENIMRMIATAPEKVKEICRIYKEPVIAYAQAQIEAGIDVLDFADHATAGLVSAETYRDIVMPVHKEIISRVDCPIVLHICGKTDDRMEYIIEAGFPCFNVDTAVDAYHAKYLAKDRISLWGGISNINSLLMGTPNMVKEDAYRALDAGFEVLGNECTVPLQVKTENLIAVAEAAKSYDYSRRDEQKLADFGRGLARAASESDTNLLIEGAKAVADFK